MNDTIENDPRLLSRRASVEGSRPPREGASAKLLRLHADEAWKSLHLRLIAAAYSINASSMMGVADFIQEATLEFVDEHGHDIEALGGVVAVTRLITPLLKRARDRRRKSYAVRKASLRLTDRVVHRSGQSTKDPEARLIETAEFDRWNDYIAKVQELAVPDAQVKLLIDAFARDEDAAEVAYASGFTKSDLHNARRRLRRLATEAAELLDIGAHEAEPEGDKRP